MVGECSLVGNEPMYREKWFGSGSRSGRFVARDSKERGQSLCLYRVSFSSPTWQPV